MRKLALIVSLTLIAFSPCKAWNWPWQRTPAPAAPSSEAPQPAPASAPAAPRLGGAFAKMALTTPAPETPQEIQLRLQKELSDQKNKRSDLVNENPNGLFKAEGGKIFFNRRIDEQLGFPYQKLLARYFFLKQQLALAEQMEAQEAASRDPKLLPFFGSNLWQTPNPDGEQRGYLPAQFYGSDQPELLRKGAIQTGFEIAQPGFQQSGAEDTQTQEIFGQQVQLAQPLNPEDFTPVQDLRPATPSAPQGGDSQAASPPSQPAQMHSQGSIIVQGQHFPPPQEVQFTPISGGGGPSTPAAELSSQPRQSSATGALSGFRIGGTRRPGR